MSSAIYLGIDLGTSGVRGSAIDERGKELAAVRLPLPHLQQPSDWQHAAFNCIAQLCDQLEPGSIRAIAIDGTSVNSYADLKIAMIDKQPGDAIDIELARDVQGRSERLSLHVELGSRGRPASPHAR